MEDVLKKLGGGGGGLDCNMMILFLNSRHFKAQGHFFHFATKHVSTSSVSVAKTKYNIRYITNTYCANAMKCGRISIVAFHYNFNFVFVFYKDGRSTSDIPVLLTNTITILQPPLQKQLQLLSRIDNQIKPKDHKIPI